MRVVIAVIGLSFLLVGCNINESKEARTQKLETGIEESSKRIDLLEKRLKELEEDNNDLKLQLAGIINQ